LETYCSGIHAQNQLMPADNEDFKAISLKGSQKYLAEAFTTSEEYDALYYEVYLRMVGTPTGDMTVQICPDSSGPNYGNPTLTKFFSVSSLITVLGASNPDSDWMLVSLKFASAGTLATSTKFWVTITHTNGGDTNYIQIGGSNDASGSAGADSKQSTDGSSWAGHSDAFYYRMTPAYDDFIAHFYEYKGALYFATQPDDNGAAKVFLNGFRGACDSNNGALTTLKDSTQTTWTTATMAGTIAKIM
ncbi:unnamed protein product, partial [marine sediment metagenome]